MTMEELEVMTQLLVTMLEILPNHPTRRRNGGNETITIVVVEVEAAAGKELISEGKKLHPFASIETTSATFTAEVEVQ